MRRLLLASTVMFVFATNALYSQTFSKKDKNEKLGILADRYYDEHSRLNPILATIIGDNRYNDLLYIDFTDSFRSSGKNIYQNFLAQLKKVDRGSLNDDDKINYDVLKWELDINIEGLSMQDNVMPFNQFESLSNELAVLGSGSGSQPFKTVKDYENWLHRATVFPAWSDSAIVYFKKGAAQKVVLPKLLVEKMIPQLEALVSADPAKSPYYGPISKLPTNRWFIAAYYTGNENGRVGEAAETVSFMHCCGGLFEKHKGTCLITR